MTVALGLKEWAFGVGAERVRPVGPPKDFLHRLRVKASGFSKESARNFRAPGYNVRCSDQETSSVDGMALDFLADICLPTHKANVLPKWGTRCIRNWGVTLG